MKRILFGYAMAAMLGSGFADDNNSFAAVRKMADEGGLEEAFRAFAAMPGGEYAAVAVARGDAAKFLALSQADTVLMDSPRGRLIEAELLLASGRKDEAREHFRALAAVAGKGDWGTGQPGYYPVEPPGSSSELAFFKLAAPFSYGPGSHRDNWLLRRLIALELMDEAAREFARIWEIHRTNARPYAVVSPQQDETLPPELALKQLVRPHGFNSLGLQFAQDYAYFLKRMDRKDEALDVLLEPLRVIDMDRNPNIISPQPFGAENPVGHPVRRMPVSTGFRRGLVGVARKEFIRLAYGEFKHAGRAGAVADALQQQIDQGGNRARRVLAQVKLHEGETEAALALELAYIEHGGFNAVSAAYRKGLIFEANGNTAEAVSAFEQVLAADPVPLNAPDADEQISAMSQHAMFLSEIRMFGAMALNRREVAERLQRLYAALGRMDKVLEYQFAQFDANENQLENLQQIEEMATRLKTAGEAARFTEWAKGKLATAKSPRARANLAWLLGDYPAAIHHAAEVYQGHYHERLFWRANFAKADPKHEMEYLRSIVKSRPTDAVARLELLELENNVEGLEAIAALEALLATDADEAFPRSKGIQNRTSFDGYFDLAYRLMRLYEKHDLLDRLRILGLWMAKAGKPFDDFDSHGYERIGSNGREEFGNACLALAIQHADDPVYQTELAAALETSRWVGARSQMTRRTGTKPAARAVGVSPPWANLPPGTRVIVSCESVACTARNERFVYVGLPWGVAVYDSKGVPATRILLGYPVTHLVAAGNQLWVGSEAGLFCITAGTWKVTHEPVGEVEALGLDGDQLWIGVSGRQDNGLMVLNRHTLAMRTFSAEEIGIKRTLDFTRFESDGEYVWADNYFGLLRYERATDTWSAVENPGPRDPVHLIGITIPTHAWPDGLRTGVRSTRWSDRWPSDAVWAVLFDDARKQDWLCVGAGLAVMPREGGALRHFVSTEGLTLGPMLDGVALGGKLYFASAWDDHRGSLTVHDPKTGVFTPWFRSDGMDSDKVVGLAVKDGQLEVRYGVEYPGDDTDNHLAPGRLDPTTGQFTSGGAERIAPLEGNCPAPAINGILPVLGGPAYRSYKRDGMTWHCGGRGLVIHRETKAPVLRFKPMQVRRVPSPAEISREEAKKIKIPDPIPAALLSELVKHPNPNVRFRAVKAAHGPLMTGQAMEYAPILLDCVNDPFPRVRGISVWLLSQCNDPAALPPLREALDDTDAGIRAMATVAMARLGEVPLLEHFESVIKHSDRYSSFSYGDDSSFSVGANVHQVLTSLARHADRRIFELLVTLPPPNLHYTEPVFPELGESLRKHPDAAAVLLAVQDENRHGPWRKFVQSTFQHAGKEMLPILHEALASDDRVVRSNAARACGAIGDPSSIPHLMQSLDMESGLVRASIVWALGELKADEAVPRLIRLHQNERNAEKSHREGAGILALNTTSFSHGEYTALNNLNAIESDWNELKTSAVRPPPDPRRDEDLLTPEHILEAVRKIGTAKSQEFYRALAAADNATDRLEATLGLSQAGPAGREENLAILRNLLADPLREVRASACVSLHFLGETGLERVFREGDPAEREELLRQMKRLPVPLLEPMRGIIDAHANNSEESEHSRALAGELRAKLGK